MPKSGVEIAIRELEGEAERLRGIIKLLSEVYGNHGKERLAGRTPKRPKERRLSADARRRMSEASKKRWAAARAKAASKR